MTQKLLLLLLLTACGYYEEKHAPVTTADPTWADIEAKIITPHCIRCHDNLTADYVRANAELVFDMIDTGTMPYKRERLSQALIDMFKNWINGGMK